MDNKKKLKKCPYCELNYIPIDKICCKICYSEFVPARQAVNDYIKQVSKQQRLSDIRKQKITLTHKKELEKQSKIELLNLLNSYNFCGFLHTTDFDNFISIYRSGFLKSRIQLIKENHEFKNNAENDVLAHTSDYIKSKLRFYYRPITPTNISAYLNHKQTRPVMLVFDKQLIFNDNAIFSNGCCASYSTDTTATAKQALSYNWEEIFSKGPFDNTNIFMKNHRNAEFLLPSPLSLNSATKIYFRNIEDYNEACKIFGKDERFEHNRLMFY